jgi:hypothetical protein
MSPIQAGDLLLCQRGTTQYKVLAEDLRTEAPPAEPWTPLDEPNLFVWVDCRDPLKRNISNGRVSQVESQNNSQFVFANNNAAVQPIVKSDDGIGFEPTVSALLNPALLNQYTPPYSGPLMWFVGGDLLAHEQSPNTLNGLAGFRNSNGSAVVLSLLAQFGTESSPGAPQNFHELGVSGYGSSPGVVFRMSGVDMGTELGVWVAVPNDNPTACCVVSQDNVTWAADWVQSICSDALPGRPLRGSLYDVVVLKPPANDLALAQRLEGWAMHRYGRASELPDDHPYKNAPPTK